MFSIIKFKKLVISLKFSIIFIVCFLVNQTFFPFWFSCSDPVQLIEQCTRRFSSCVALFKVQENILDLRETYRPYQPPPYESWKTCYLASLENVHPPPIAPPPAEIPIVLSCRQTSTIWAIFRQSSTSWCHHLLCNMCPTSTIISHTRISVLLQLNCPWLLLHLAQSVRKPFAFQQENTAI